jgi:hypothetical protein
MKEPAYVLSRPPAGDSVAKSNKRPFRKPGDDIDCFIGIKVSIKTMSSRGLVSSAIQPNFGPTKTQAMQTMCLYKARTMTSLSEGIFSQDYLDSLLEGWWKRGARVPQAKAVAEDSREMGDRYDNLGGGGNYGRDDG